MTEPDATQDAALILTRALLMNGSLISSLANVHPDLRLLSDAERAESLQAMLRTRPDQAGDGSPGEGVWLFAYGSLIWNPLIHFAERRVARVQGWHRAFCLATPVGRGTPQLPGLVLALDQGGDCVGAALRIPEELVAAELDLVWRREMLSGAYVPRWVPVADPDTGCAFGHAIAFTINPANPFYVGQWDEARTVASLAHARGRLGSAADYLFRTRAGLRGLGIADELVERLAAAVERVQAERARAPGSPHPDGSSA
jgi:cation transport protein ChaC